MSLLQMPRTNLSPKRTFSVYALYLFQRGSISINFHKIFNSFHFCFDQKDRPVELRRIRKFLQEKKVGRHWMVAEWSSVEKLEDT